MSQLTQKDIDEKLNKTEKPKMKVEKIQYLTQDDKKKRIAEICSSITLKPESSFKKQQNEEKSLFTELHEYTDDLDEKIQEIAILSEYVVLNDILPVYYY